MLEGRRVEAWDVAVREGVEIGIVFGAVAHGVVVSCRKVVVCLRGHITGDRLPGPHFVLVRGCLCRQLVVRVLACMYRIGLVRSRDVSWVGVLLCRVLKKG